MNIIIFISNCPIQKALANKISDEFTVNKVWISNNITSASKIKGIKRVLYFTKRLIRVPFEMPFRLVWNKLKNSYMNTDLTALDKVKKQYVDNINDEVVVNFIMEKKPNLIIVSATTMIKNFVINEAKKVNCVILNLHTGVSPYIKGGPNCTNWCLAKNYYLIGNTVMTLDKGIDSGAIISTELTELTGNENLFELHHKVMEHGFDLYMRVIQEIIHNKMKIQPISQDDISTDGCLFYTKDWTIINVIKAYINFKIKYKKGVQSFITGDNVRLVPIRRIGKSVE